MLGKLRSGSTPNHVELGRQMAKAWVDENLDGDEDAKEAVEEASFLGDNSAQSGAMAVVSLVVALTVGAIIAAYLLPLGIEEISSATLGADASEGAESIWGILDVMIVLAVFLFFVSIALAAADKV